MSDSLRTVDILLVEDNPHDVELSLRAFKKANMTNEIVVKRDGQEAVDYLEACVRDGSQRLPGIILLDLNLPKLSGHEVLERLKGNAELARIPVIMLTASTREQDVVRSYDLGVNTFISKPVEFADFMRVVATIQQYWITIATLPPTEVVVSSGALESSVRS